MSGLKQRRVVEIQYVPEEDMSNKALSVMISSINSINSESSTPEVESIKHEDDQLPEPTTDVQLSKPAPQVVEEPKPLGFFAALKEMLTTDLVAIGKKGE